MSRRLRRVGLVAVIAVAAASCGDGSPRSSDTEAGTVTVAPLDPATLRCPVTTEEAETALRAGVRALRRSSSMRADTAWVLRTVTEQAPDLGPFRRPADADRQEPSDPAWALVGDRPPTTPAPDPPADARGRFGRDLSLVFLAEPGPAPEALLAYLRRDDLQGYALTHQWLSLRWAAELGVVVGDAAALADGYRSRVRSELGDPAATDDLWGEQVALLALDGSAAATELAEWQCRIVRLSQHGDGIWRPDGRSYLQRYDGGSFEVRSDFWHLASVLTLALATVLHEAES